MRHAEAYLKAAAGRRLATHTTSDVESWLADLGRIGRMKPWQFGQAVDAVRFLFVLIRSPVADAVDWAYWRDSMKPLPDDHPTIARSHGVSASSGADQAPADSAEGVVARLIAVIRQRNYSIRTEETCRGWAERFLRCIRGSTDPLTAEATEVKAFLQALAVEGRVGGNGFCCLPLAQPVFSRSRERESLTARQGHPFSRRYR